MKAAFLEGPGILSVKDVRKPVLERGEVLVRMSVCGVCGTDLEKLRGEAITPPVLGHEVVGQVEEVAEGVEGLKEGDRVFPHHHAPCYTCEICRRGEYTLCPEFPKHNIRPCGFSEYFAVPAWNVSKGAVLKLPASLSFEEASFIEPLGCCIRGLEKAGWQTAANALIYGAGPVGLMHLKLLRTIGCEVAVTDLSGYRLGYAEKLGASATFTPNDEAGKRKALSELGEPQLVILATGSMSAFQDAVRTVARGGRVLLFGAPPRGSKVQVDLASLFLSGITLVTSYSTSEKETGRALEMLSRGVLRLSDLVTHRFSIEDTAEAFRVAGDQKCIKAVVKANA